MTTAITSGIQVSVESFFEGRFIHKKGPLYLFSYRVLIENKSPVPVQLLGRHWYIFDTGDEPGEVQGEGVIGKQPILQPGERFTYESGCHLRSTIGMMKGYYHFVNLNDELSFKVLIPSFQFFATPLLN